MNSQPFLPLSLEDLAQQQADLAAIGEVWRGNFQSWQDQFVTGWLAEENLLRDIPEFSTLAVEIAGLFKVRDEFLSLEKELTSGFMPTDGSEEANFPLEEKAALMEQRSVPSLSLRQEERQEARILASKAMGKETQRETAKLSEARDEAVDRQRQQSALIPPSRQDTRVGHLSPHRQETSIKGLPDLAQWLEWEQQSQDLSEDKDSPYPGLDLSELPAARNPTEFHLGRERNPKIENLLRASHSLLSLESLDLAQLTSPLPEFDFAAEGADALDFLRNLPQAFPTWERARVENSKDPPLSQESLHLAQTPAKPEFGVAAEGARGLTSLQNPLPTAISPQGFSPWKRIDGGVLAEGEMLLAENPIPSHKSLHPFPSEAVSTGSVDRTGQFSKGVCEEWEASKTQNQPEESLERQQTWNLQTDLAGRDGHQDWSEEDLEPILEAIARQIQQEYRQFYGG